MLFIHTSIHNTDIWPLWVECGDSAWKMWNFMWNRWKTKKHSCKDTCRMKRFLLLLCILKWMLKNHSCCILKWMLKNHSCCLNIVLMQEIIISTSTYMHAYINVCLFFSVKWRTWKRSAVLQKESFVQLGVKRGLI